MITLVRDAAPGESFDPIPGPGIVNGRYDLGNLGGLSDDSGSDLAIVIFNVGYQQVLEAEGGVPSRIFCRLQHPDEDPRHIIRIFDNFTVSAPDRGQTFEKAGCYIPVPRIGIGPNPAVLLERNDGRGQSWYLDFTVEDITAASGGSIHVSFAKINIQAR